MYIESPNLQLNMASAVGEYTAVHWNTVLWCIWCWVPRIICMSLFHLTTIVCRYKAKTTKHGINRRRTY